MMPFLPLLLLAAGYHLETFFESLDKKSGAVKILFVKNGLLTLCLGWLALFSAAILTSQNDSFGDIKRSSQSPQDALTRGRGDLFGRAPHNPLWVRTETHSHALPGGKYPVQA